MRAIILIIKKCNIRILYYYIKYITLKKLRELKQKLWMNQNGFMI